MYENPREAMAPPCPPLPTPMPLTVLPVAEKNRNYLSLLLRFKRFYQQSNLSLYSPYNAEAYNELRPSPRHTAKATQLPA